jgi:hypothetical protein
VEPGRLERLETKLDHVANGVDLLVSRIEKLERRASFWGALGGALTAIVTHLAGCF